MPKKTKPAAAPAPAPETTKRRPPVRLTAKARALDAIAVALRAVVGHDALTAMGTAFQDEARGLADSWAPVKERTGPPVVGDWAKPRPGQAALDLAHVPAPFQLVRVYKRGKVTLVDARSATSLLFGLVLSQLVRVDPPAAPVADPDGIPFGGEEQPRSVEE